MGFGGRAACVWGRARWEVPLHVWGTANNVAILPELLGCGVDRCEGSVDGGLVMGIATCVVLASRVKPHSAFETVDCGGANDDDDDKVYLFYYAAPAAIAPAVAPAADAAASYASCAPSPLSTHRYYKTSAAHLTF
jgi:hypothetical protein